MKRVGSLFAVIVALFACTPEPDPPGGGTPVTPSPSGSPTPQPDTTWSFVYGDASDQTIRAMVVESDGDVWIAGTFDGTIDIGTGPLTTAGATDVLLAQLDGEGNGTFAARFGDAADQTVADMAMDANGNLILVGTFAGTVNFGGGDLTSAGGTDIFVAVFNSSGAHVASSRFGDVDDQSATSVAIDGGANVVVGGTFVGTLNFGGGDLVSSSAMFGDAFVARLSPTLTHLYSGRLGDLTGIDIIHDVSIGADDDIWVAGEFVSTIDLGIATLNAAGGTTDTDGFVLRMDNSGNALAYTQAFGLERQAVTHIEARDNGSVCWGGVFADAGSVDIDGVVYNNAGGDDGFVACFGVVNGVLYFADVVATQDDDALEALFITSDEVLAAYSSASDGTYKKHDTITGAGNQYSAAAVGTYDINAGALRGNHLYFAGSLEGTVDFGDGELTSNGIDAVIVRNP